MRVLAAVLLILVLASFTADAAVQTCATQTQKGSSAACRFAFASDTNQILPLRGW